VSNVGASQLGQCGRPVKLHQPTLAVCRCRFDGSARGENETRVERLSLSTRVLS